MQQFPSLDDIQLNGAWLSIGTFDGVHRGHQNVINQLVNGAHRDHVPAVILTFFPHPSVVLGKRDQAYYLTSPKDRAKLIGEMGVDIVINQPFTLELAHNSANEFISNIYAHLGFQKLVVGYDFAMGKNRTGDVSHLKKIGDAFGFSVITVPPFVVDGRVVSSSEVRTLLLAGDVRNVFKLLGRYYSLEGEVVLGDGRGRQLQIPTANFSIWAQQVLPKPGVYVCRVYQSDDCWWAVTNIGVRPTFELEPVPVRLEAHLLDYDGDLYGQQLKLEFIERLRDELRFISRNELVEQIRLDIDQARSIIERV